MPAKTNWDRISRANHWIIALVMIGMLIFGVYLEDFVPRGPDKRALIGTHKSIGVMVLLFGLWRVGYRLVQGFLDDAAPMAKWQSVMAKVVHWVLLVAVIAMPLTGLLGSYFAGRAVDVFGIFTLPGAPDANRAIADVFNTLHGLFGKIAILAVLLHIVGALKHHVIDKDSTLKRMLGRA